ncbi:hypothetical protein OQA88_6123 [Cercophora sp. LCS_1]
MADANGGENTARQQREFAQQIRIARKKGSLVICAGAGVQLFATADASGRIHQQSLTWLRLMRSGFDYIEEHLPSAYNDLDNKDRIQKARATLDVPDKQYSEADEAIYLDAAQTLTDILKSFPSSFADWLRQQFQTLDESLTHPEIHNILKRLHQEGVHLMTTNYDGLLENHCGLTHVDISHPAEDGNNRVFHPHGEWEHPNGIVLNSREYYAGASTGKDNPAQSLLRDIFRSKTVLFVGCGPGTGDPNFGEMLRWLGSQQTEIEGNIRQSHYILLRNRDNYREVEGRLPLVKVRVEMVDDIPRWLEGLLETSSL